MKLKGKTAVITGGTKGLGKALAFRFAEQGAHIALCGRSQDLLKRTQLELSAFGVRTLAEQCDISDADQVQRFAERVLEEFSDVDVLVNNASLLGSRVPIVEYSAPRWEQVIQVNVNGLFYVTKAFLPSMIHRRSGSIINVASSVGKHGRAGWGAYAVSKFALEGFTQTLAQEMQTYGIRVNSVNPGAMATEMRHAAYPEENPSTLPSPSSATDVFVYLASDASRHVTGQYLEAQSFTLNQ
ncbi:MAG: SDR family NAD(P)-dependent oxidoreductase [Bacteroidota bacterium]